MLNTFLPQLDPYAIHQERCEEFAAVMRANVNNVHVSEADEIISAICTALDLNVVDALSMCQRTDYVTKQW